MMYQWCCMIFANLLMHNVFLHVFTFTSSITLQKKSLACTFSISVSELSRLRDFFGLQGIQPQWNHCTDHMGRRRQDGLPDIMRSKKSSEGFITSELDLGLGAGKWMSQWKVKLQQSMIKHDRRKFKNQTSDNMDRWKAEVGRVRQEKRREEKRRREKIREDQRRERVRRTKMQAREKTEKSRSTVLFPLVCGPGGSKSRLAKAPSGPMRDEKLHAVVARSTFKSKYVKMYKTHDSRNTFGSCHVEKVHVIVARSTFPSQKGTKHTMLGPLLEVEMSKKRTPLWHDDDKDDDDDDDDYYYYCCCCYFYYYCYYSYHCYSYYSYYSYYCYSYYPHYSYYSYYS